MASFLPSNDINLTAWLPLIDEINEKAEGRLHVNFVGGPEAMPGFKQFDACSSGVLDMLYSCESYYGVKAFGANFTHLSRISPMEEREAGFNELLNEIFEPSNIYYLGRANPHSAMWFNIFTNKAVSTPQEMKGQTIRVSATYEPFVKALGCAAVTLPGGEVYTALERGTVDGYAWCAIGNVGSGWPEVCKYIIAPRIYTNNVLGIINLDSWNALPGDLQDLLNDCMIENEVKYTPIMGQLCEDEYQEMQDMGMEVITFSPEDTEWYTDLAYSSAWAVINEGMPEYGPQFEKLMSP